MRLDDDEGPAPKRRKTLPNGADLLRRATAQLTNKKSTPRRTSLAALGDQKSRKGLANKKTASLLTLDSRVKDGRIVKRRSVSSFTVAELQKRRKSSGVIKRSRHSMPASKALASSPSSVASPLRISSRISPKTNKFLAMKENVKKSSTSATKSALNKISDLKKNLGSSSQLSKDPNDPFNTGLLSRNTASNNSNKKQARLSLGHGTWEMTLHAPPTAEDIMADIAAGKVKIPKRSSSLSATKAISGRPSTAVSVAQSVKKGAAVAKGTLKGFEGVRQTIRAVSGAEGV